MFTFAFYFVVLALFCLTQASHCYVQIHTTVLNHIGSSKATVFLLRNYMRFILWIQQHEFAE